MRIIIIGGGGFGLELYTYIEHDINTGKFPINCTIGILDESNKCEVLTKIPNAKYLGRIQDFSPSAGDKAIIAIGNILGRKENYKIAQQKNIPLGNYIHPSAFVASNAKLGNGIIICPNSVISAYANIQDNVAINVFCGVGHGANIGMHTVMGPNSIINGDTSLGEGCLLGTRSTLFPKISLGKGCSVDAHTVVKVSTGDFKIISTKGQYLEFDNRVLLKKY